MSAAHVDPVEWSQIFYSDGPAERPVMSVPPRVRATTKFIRETKYALELGDEQAVQVADYIVDKMERFGATSAQPVFDMDGNGPICSWCTVIWPLCGHQHLSLALGDDEEPTE